MSSPELPGSPKKKRSILWWLAGGFLLLVCLFLVQLFGPNPKIILSKQTTYITSPLRPDGMPNYGQYLLESSRNGIIPENNAAPLMWRAMGLGRIDAKDRAAFAAELGITDDQLLDHPLEPAYAPQTRRRVAAWLNDQGRLTLPGQTIDKETIDQLTSGSYKYSNPQFDQLNDMIEEFIYRASVSPWTSKQNPPLAAWVADNQPALDLLVAASKRTQFYSPWPALLHGESSMQAAMPMDSIQAYREIARALPVRAMWHAGEGRPIEAWHDLLAVHHLANLCAGHTLVEYLVAISMSNTAFETTFTLLGNTNLSADEAREILHDLSTLTTFPTLSDSVDHGERIFSLDMISEAAASGGGFSMLADSPTHPANGNLLNHVAVDWNIVLTEMNYRFDQITAALRITDPVARSAAASQVFADMQQARSDAWTASKLMTSVISRRQRSRLVAASLVDMLMPALQSLDTCANRANTMLDLARLAAALAVYHAEHSAYPEKLAELVPSILPKLPTDAYHAKPFLYRRTADGYLLYSAGENGDDDAGSNSNMHIFEGYDTDDLGKLTPPQTPRISDECDDVGFRIPQLKTKPPFDSSP